MKADEIQLTEWDLDVINESYTDKDYVLNWKNQVKPYDDSEFVKILKSKKLFYCNSKSDLANLIELMDKIGANYYEIHYDKDYNNWIELSYRRTKREILNIKIRNEELKLSELKKQLNTEI